MEQNLASFAERTGIRVRYGCRWESTRREDDPDGARFVLGTSDGDYRCRVAVFAVGALSRGSGAPMRTHSSKFAMTSLESFPPDFCGGICVSASV